MVVGCDCLDHLHDPLVSTLQVLFLKNIKMMAVAISTTRGGDNVRSAYTLAASTRDVLVVWRDHDIQQRAAVLSVGLNLMQIKPSGVKPHGGLAHVLAFSGHARPFGLAVIVFIY